MSSPDPSPTSPSVSESAICSPPPKDRSASPNPFETPSAPSPSGHDQYGHDQSPNDVEPKSAASPSSPSPSPLPDPHEGHSALNDSSHSLSDSIDGAQQTVIPIGETSAAAPSSASASSPSPSSSIIPPSSPPSDGPPLPPGSTLSENDLIVLKTYKHEKLIRTLFGATFHCKCIVNDEVRLTVWILFGVAVACVLGFFIADVDTGRLSPQVLQTDEERIAVAIAGTFTITATILSYIQIRAHHQNWVHPPSQRCVVRILMMVPVYSISALLSLMLFQYSLYIDFIRGCYEAFVIYQFVLLLTKYLGGDQGVVECLRFKPPLAWPAPLGRLPKMNPDRKFLTFIKYGTLQYTLLNPVCSVFAITMDMFGLYEDGVIDFTRGYVYVAFVQNFSQLTALYCLVWFYVVLKNELAPFKPMSKFLVVKSVVFFTFWQSVGLAILVHLSVFSGTADEISQEQTGIQDLLVCFEMFIAAAAHKYTFGYETYANGTIKLLMDQRAIYIAELHYKRAKEAAEAQEMERLRQLQGEGMKGLSLNEVSALAAGMAMPMPKKKKKKIRKSAVDGGAGVPHAPEILTTIPDESAHVEMEPLTVDKEAIHTKIDNVANEMAAIDSKLPTTGTIAPVPPTPSSSSSYFHDAPFTSTVRNQYGEIQRVKSALPGLEDIARMRTGGMTDKKAQEILKLVNEDEGSALVDDDDIGSLVIKLAPVTSQVTGFMKSTASSAIGITSQLTSTAANKFTSIGKGVTGLLKSSKRAQANAAAGIDDVEAQGIKQENKQVEEMTAEARKSNPLLQTGPMSPSASAPPTTPSSTRASLISRFPSLRKPTDTSSSSSSSVKNLFSPRNSVKKSTTTSGGATPTDATATTTTTTSQNSAATATPTEVVAKEKEESV